MNWALAGVGLILTGMATPSFAQSQGSQDGADRVFKRGRLEGVWSNSSVTDLQRPANIASLVLTPDQARAIEDSDPGVARMRSANERTDPSAGLLDGSDLASGRGYNSFWVDPGVQIATVKGELRSSWIVDPPDGRIPFSASGKTRAAALSKDRGTFVGPETRPLGERCLTIGNRVGPPMINGLYNNNYQFVETPDAVLIYVEMVPTARVVRLNSQHAPASVRPMFGDTIGWWEGDTLVAETTNFHPLHAANAAPANLSADAKVVERFTRVSDSQILYEFTVEDPQFYTQPWKGEMSLNAVGERMFEYACHEGNYSMEGVLMGARIQERQESRTGARKNDVGNAAVLND